MRIRSIRFAMVRVHAQFENNRAEVEVELDNDGEFEVALEIAMARCEQALGLKTPSVNARNRGTIHTRRA